MYYLFISKKKDIEKYRKEFDRCLASMRQGKTPVYSEIRGAKTNLAESLPYNFLCGAFLVVGTLLLNKLQIPEVVKVAVVLVINSVLGAFANFLFVCAKHRIRLSLCDRIGVPRTEESIAVMESLEYQSV